MLHTSRWLVIGLLCVFGCALFSQPLLAADSSSVPAPSTNPTTTDAAPTGVASSRDLPPGLIIPTAARPGASFDVEQATQAYLDLLTPEQRATSDAYFEGGYWLQLWQLLYGLAVAAVLVLTGLSRRMRDWARRVSQRPWLITVIYGALFLVAMFVLGFPLSVYADFYREHQYGLATQTFPAWLGDQVTGLAFTILMGTPFIALLYLAVRRAGERWWRWATGLTFVFLLFTSFVYPVFVAPAFNTFTSLPAGSIRESVLSLARANMIPANDVYVFDASRQTTRISANVSGLLNTTRISLNDNLLKHTSEPEIRAVLGHEMGHYALNHVLRGPIYLTLVFALVFFITHKSFDALLARHGAKWGFDNRADPAALPVAVAVISIAMFILTPVQNNIVRQAEAEADAYGINAAREPYGFATAAMRLSTYRKLHPGPIEEFVFYDHPSGYNRVRRCMLWLKENQQDPQILAELALAPH